MDEEIKVLQERVWRVSDMYHAAKINSCSPDAGRMLYAREACRMLAGAALGLVAAVRRDDIEAIAFVLVDIGRCARLARDARGGR